MTRARLVLQGPPLEAAGSFARLASIAMSVTARRLAKGPRRPSWTRDFEIATAFFLAQGDRVFGLAEDGAGIARARRATDALQFRMPALDAVQVVVAERSPLPARWFVTGRPGPTTLHLHGGGYVFSPGMTDNLIAAVALALGGKMLVPAYRLAPEHPLPAAIDDAEACHRWLVDSAPDAPLLLSGDSAGGHAVLALLQRLRRDDGPMPAAAIAISPWTDLNNGGDSMRSNVPFDWMDPGTSNRMGQWAGRDHLDPGLARIDGAALTGLPPILIQAGEAEICRDMIRRTAGEAIKAGADLTLEEWPDMNHNFQGFGDMMPAAREALQRIGAFAAAALARRVGYSATSAVSPA